MSVTAPAARRAATAAGTYAADVAPGHARDDGDIVISDPRAIRALAHPARVAVLERLFAGSVLTATECAAVAGLTPSAMSYHLRALEKYGLVGRADPTGDGRERPWRALGTGMRVEADAPAAVVMTGLRLTPDEVRDLAARVEALLAPYEGRAHDRPGALEYHAYWVTAPALPPGADTAAEPRTDGDDA